MDSKEDLKAALGTVLLKEDIQQDAFLDWNGTIAYFVAEDDIAFWPSNLTPDAAYEQDVYVEACLNTAGALEPILKENPFGVFLYDEVCGALI